MRTLNELLYDSIAIKEQALSSKIFLWVRSDLKYFWNIQTAEITCALLLDVSVQYPEVGHDYWILCETTTVLFWIWCMFSFSIQDDMNSSSIKVVPYFIWHYFTLWFCYFCLSTKSVYFFQLCPWLIPSLICERSCVCMCEFSQSLLCVVLTTCPVCSYSYFLLDMWEFFCILRVPTCWKGFLVTKLFLEQCINNTSDSPDSHKYYWG